MEHIINRIALDHDLPVDTIRKAMEEAIHEGFQNPDGCMREVFGNREPSPEELIAVLAKVIEDVEFEDESEDSQ